jgi:hypothetical protein
MNHYSLRRYWISTLILLFIAISIKLFSLNHTLVEQYYSTGLYIFISNSLRIVTGWLPISIGDVLYAAVAIWMIVKLVRHAAALFRRKVTINSFVRGALKITNLLLLIYIIFYSMWGLNYDRKGIAAQLHLQPGNVTTQDLSILTDSLLVKVNSTRLRLGDTVQYASYKTVFSQSVEAYRQAQQQYPFLNYRFRSIKSSMYSTLGNYLGFSGYYNPFSGEAQVNTTMPPFVLPFVTCHEMGHQLGYGTEDEANFTAYLAAKCSNDKQFQYSLYYDLFNYANSTLYLYDSVAARNNYKQLDTLVKRDIAVYRQFLFKYKNPLEPLINVVYGNYLRVNNQPQGMETYNLVVTWLIAYQKKYGTL